MLVEKSTGKGNGKSTGHRFFYFYFCIVKKEKKHMETSYAAPIHDCNKMINVRKCVSSLFLHFTTGSVSEF